MHHPTHQNIPALKTGGLLPVVSNRGRRGGYLIFELGHFVFVILLFRKQINCELHWVERPLFLKGSPPRVRFPCGHKGISVVTITMAIMGPKMSLGTSSSNDGSKEGLRGD